MDKKIEKIAKIICKHPEVKTCKECGHTCRARADAVKLIEAGCGNIEQAIIEFAKKVGFLFCPECDYGAYDIRETIINYAKEFINAVK